ncbi:EcsC family protein [Trinickia fusca]|uniref:EcsC family protein n=1 Tax=Trinickia fusca TaxID=2419777 RepID=A0A494XHA6_9BURK|nr:EcsC family protein [Trinickia fusca]RKP49182.1 EcsC family protein [Trinickia fusca]
MEPIPFPVSSLEADDLAALGQAKRALETEPLAMKLAAAVGTPIERLIARLPASAQEAVTDATRRALEKCLQVASSTLGTRGTNGVASTGARDRLHKLAVATTGAAGGAFGLIALPAELPLTTTLMFRSILDIARSEGENLGSIETRLQCLSVFGLGGGSASRDEEADFGYFVVRAALAQSVSKASSDLAAKGLMSHASPALMRLLNAIAARFSVQVSEQVAAKSIPAIGAVLGALANTVFIDHFQHTAHGHFTVRRLERRYGTDAVRAAYQTIEPAPNG